MKCRFPANGRLVLTATIASLCALGSASAANRTPSHTKHHASSKSAKKAPAKPVEVAPPEAAPEQLAAAEQVYFGAYQCEFKQVVDVEKDAKYPGYVDVTSGKQKWTMRPVVSSTGAIRLEDVNGETLLVQISSKSMLLNVKTAHRIVDDCVSERQRELIAAAKAARAAFAAARAAGTASGVFSVSADPEPLPLLLEPSASAPSR